MIIQELKIGNWVYDSKTTMFPMQVVAIGTDWIHLDFFGNEGDVWEVYPQDVEPIPITEEILLKCGFEKEPFSSKIYKINTDDYCVIYYFEGNTLDVRTKDGNRVSILCKHIHQLQNAYYLVTNKELEINL